MLALTTVAPTCAFCSRCCISATQPLPRAMPYSADRLSPTTSTLVGLAIAREGTAPAKVSAATLQCASQTRRVSPPGRPKVEHRRAQPVGSSTRCAPASNSMPDPIIAVERVNKQVRDSSGMLTILHDIAFTLQPRESAAIVGASGSGKSTLLGIVAGLDTPSSGTVHLAGQDLFALDEDQRAALRARQLGFVFQSFQLLGNLSALENVMLPLELLGLNGARDRATEMLQRVGLGERLTHYPRTLSGGEQQRVALARAFVVRPAVLLADEPTGSLDFATGERVMELMFELNREAGTTLLLVTHDSAIASRCDRQLHIEAGRLAAA